MISPQPILVSQEVMNIVREYQLFKFDPSLAKLPHKLDRLIELYVSIIVPMNQQHRRFPFVHRADRRRLSAELCQIAGRPRGRSHTSAPVMNAVEINSRRE